MTLAMPSEHYVTLGLRSYLAPMVPATPTATEFRLRRVSAVSRACSELGTELDALSQALFSRLDGRSASEATRADRSGQPPPDQRWIAFTTELEQIGAPQVQAVTTVWTDLAPTFAATVPDAGLTEDGRVVIEWRTASHVLSLEVLADQRVLWYFEDLVHEVPEANDEPQAWSEIVDAVRNRLALIARA